MNWFVGILLFGLIAVTSSPSQNLLSLVTTYTDTCDASAAVTLDADRFVVASDEDNILRIYSLSRPGPPVSAVNVSEFLQLTKRSPEADLEGAARVGNRIFWISSHIGSASGNASPNRQRLFATDIRTTKDATTLVPVGAPCRTLLRDLIREQKFRQFNLARAAETDPKKSRALNIEGLAATPEGHLLIGFRTPIPKRKALLIPLLNPNAVLEGKPASFGEAILLDLNGLGIRSLDYHAGRYWIIAGHYDNKVPARLYSWAGGKSEPRWHSDMNLAGFNPEAMLVPDDSTEGKFYIISDDGGVSIGGKDCKDLKDPSLKRFRCYPVTINDSAAAN
jgi:hypothetical protein